MLMGKRVSMRLGTWGWHRDVGMEGDKETSGMAIYMEISVGLEMSVELGLLMELG